MAKRNTKEEENAEKGKVYDVQCVKCTGETEHHVLLSFDVSGSETVGQELEDHYGYTLSWNTSYQIIRCGGCKSISYRNDAWFSEDEGGSTESLYPVRSQGKLVAKDYHNAPTTLRRIYRETIDAFNGECLTLCAGGLRAIVEGICADKKIKKGPIQFEKDGQTITQQSKSLDGKISGLREQGYLTKAKAESLHAHRYLGNEALHDLEMPSVDELRLAIEIIEHVLEELYTIQDKIDEISWRRSKRKTGKDPTLAQKLKGKVPNNK